MEARGPIFFTTAYVVAIGLTVALTVLCDRMGDSVLKVALPILQITVTSGAIFSAWALQNQKRVDDARDEAEATADAVLAIVISIERLGDFIADRVDGGRARSLSVVHHGEMIEEEIKALASLPLTALKPSKAAVALVTYRRFARQFVIGCRRQGTRPDRTSSWLLLARLHDVRQAERDLRIAMGRKPPARLRALMTSEGYREMLKARPRQDASEQERGEPTA